ncbi:hypothetical protein LAX80_014090 (plasmid) [Listeria marthii]|nr:hypothetical protein [Listeria monocytogenes serotype 1/2a]EJS9299427.1 hypothetical protein [Listeria monocytogenes]UHP11679.1 hypothetical protein LAX80_014090 [Listeria marthii]
MTQIISAFPCLGKTTLCNLNRDTIFDREFNESRSVRGMTSEEREKFFQCCSELVQLQKNTEYYDFIFITDNPDLVTKLDQKNITFIYPNVFDSGIMDAYKKQVIERSGKEWYDRVIPPKLVNLKEYIQQLLDLNYDVRFTDAEHQYIEDVYDFHSQYLLPSRKVNTK